MFSIYIFKHFIEDDVQLELAPEMSRQQFVLGLDVDDQFPQTLVVDAQVVDFE